MLRSELDGVFQADAVENMPDGGLEGFEIRVGSSAQPLVFNLAPEGFDFVEVGAGGQVEKVDVRVFPVL